MHMDESVAVDAAPAPLTLPPGLFPQEEGQWGGDEVDENTWRMQVCLAVCVPVPVCLCVCVCVCACVCCVSQCVRV